MAMILTSITLGTVYSLAAVMEMWMVNPDITKHDKPVDSKKPS